MADLKVTFRGDLGNLSQFDSAIKNSALSSARAIQDANQKIAASIGSISGAYSGDKAGLFVRKQAAIADAVNNTFKQSGDIVRRYVSDYGTELDKMGKHKAVPIFDTAYEGSFKKNLGNLQAYERALEKVAPYEKEILDTRKKLAQTTAAISNRRTFLEERLQTVQKQKPSATLVSALTAQQTAQTDLASHRAALAQTPGSRQIQKLIRETEKELQHLARVIARERRPIEAEINKINAALARLGAREAAAGRRAADSIHGITQRGLSPFNDLRAATQATPPIQSDLARVLRESKDLQKNLLKGGLGLGTKYGTADFQRALAQQEAQVTSYTRNLRTNVRTVQGEFKDAAGLMNKFTVDLDNQGKVVGRWGSHLRGAGSVLREIRKDFQKVVEWTVATTVVFGTLAAVVGQLQNINELNTSLARFSITAQTSAQETTGLFEQLSQVAFDTATPLKEIITVADDIALATREAGDSTEEWHGKIVDLTTAVGIFTNLTGKDTVSAAEQLSASFKQLDIAPSELIGVLNKVTAVAGGQANAIADIVQSVAGLAEAAKAAGFTIDEQIASVQVLAQVTSKTSAEIATSFKNLFGSVSSVGSEKILSQFDIQVRDSTGGVRDFLDIYRDVAKAIQQGIIPQNRIPDVIRGISGGPRRAPDAAALLANIGRIDEVVLRSQGATNEALVANARILDTNQAKIIQFQNAIDTAVFEKFGDAVKNLTSILTDFGIAFARAFELIPGEVATAGIQMTLAATAMFTLGKALGFLAKGVGLSAAIGGLKNLATGLKAVKVEASAATAATLAADARLAASGLILPTGVSSRAATAGTVFPTVAGGAGRLSGLTNLLKNNKKITAGVGAVGVGAAAAGLTDDQQMQQSLGTILQIGGSLALLSGALAPVGVAAIVAGTAIQLLSGNTEQAKQKTVDLSSEIFTLTENLRATQTEAEEFGKRQREAATEMAELQSQTKLSADEQTRLAGLTTEYVTATLALATANQTVSGTFDVLLEKLGETGDKYGSLLGLTPDSPQLKKISQSLLEDILKNTPGASIYAGPQVPFTGVNRASRGAGTIATENNFGLPGTLRNQIDLTDLFDDPRLLTKIFDVGQPGGPTFGKKLYDVPTNDDALRFMQSALAQLQQEFTEGKSDLTKEQIDQLTVSILELSQSTSSLSQNTAALAQARAGTARNQALGIFNAEQTANATQAQNLIEQLLNAQKNAPTSLTDYRGYTQPVVGQSTQLVEDLGAKAAKGLAVSNAEIIKAITYTLQLQQSTTGLGSVYDDLMSKGQAAFNEGVYLSAQNAGFGVEQLSSLAKILQIDLENIAAATEDFSATFEGAKTAAREAFADRSLKLLIAENNGEFKKNAEGLAMLQAQNVAARDSTLGLIDTLTGLSDVAFVEVNNALAQTIGLEGEYISTTLAAIIPPEELAQRQAALAGKLIEAAVAAGVNAEGLEKIAEKAFLLDAAIQAITPYKQVIIDVQTRMNAVDESGYGSGRLNRLKKEYDAAVKAEKKANPTAQVKSIVDQINAIINSGRGSNFGSLGSKAAKAAKASAPYNKPGLLDIPEEIINATNTSQLLQQAIKNARNLQAKIPGETKQNRGEIVELLNGTKRVLETRGIGEDYLRRAMEELTGEIKRQNDLLSKADTIRRIRVGTGSFAGLANVPINSQSGVSVGGPQGPISVSLDVNGTVLTPAQFAQFADMIAASIKRQISA